MEVIWRPRKKPHAKRTNALSARCPPLGKPRLRRLRLARALLGRGAERFWPAPPRRRGPGTCGCSSSLNLGSPLGRGRVGSDAGSPPPPALGALEWADLCSGRRVRPSTSSWNLRSPFPPWGPHGEAGPASPAAVPVQRRVTWPIYTDFSLPRLTWEPFVRRRSHYDSVSPKPAFFLPARRSSPATGLKSDLLSFLPCPFLLFLFLSCPAMVGRRWRSASHAGMPRTPGLWARYSRCVPSFFFSFPFRAFFSSACEFRPAGFQQIFGRRKRSSVTRRGRLLLSAGGRGVCCRMEALRGRALESPPSPGRATEVPPVRPLVGGFGGERCPIAARQAEVDVP